MSDAGLACDGGCVINEECKGIVKRVIVSSIHWTPQKFHYCDTAIASDRKAGFDVEIQP